MAKDARISEQEFGINLNLDDSLKKFTPGDVIYALNCASGISKEGNVGAVENERGNKLVSLALPGGTNRVIGTAVDIQRNAIVYFVQNSSSQDCILRYNIDTNDITRILYAEPILNFKTIDSSRTGYITHANVVDKLLLWSDGIQEARKINIDKAIAFSLSGGNDPNGYSALTIETITAIKRPPRYAPTTRIYTSPLRDTNFLAQRSFNFAFRYKYDDNERSVFSPYSRAVYPPFDPYVADDVHYVNTVGMYPYIPAGDPLTVVQPINTSNKLPFSANPSAYNAIDIGVILGSDLVSEIEVLARSGEFGVWTIFDTIDNKLLVTPVNDGGEGLIPGQEYLVTFFNDKTGITVSDESALKTMDFFPINPKTQEFTHLNLLVYGNFLDGYPIVPPEDLDMNVSANIKEFHPFQWNFSFVDAGVEYSQPNPAFFYNLNKPIAEVNEWDFPAEIDVIEGRLINITTFFGNFSPLYANIGGVSDMRLRNYPWAWYRITDLDAIDYAHFKDNFVLALNNQGYYTTHDGTTFLISPALSQETMATDGLAASIWYGNMEAGEPENQWQHRTFKQGAYHQVGIVYYDYWGRHGPAQTINNKDGEDGSRVYVPMWGEIPDNQQAIDTNGYYYDLFISIDHNPPEWAYTYQIVYTGSINIDDFIQYPYRQPDEREDDPEGLRTFSFNLDSRISFTNWTNFLRLNDRVRRGYTFEVDDFVRGVKREQRFSAIVGDFEYNLNILSDSVKSERINYVDLDFLEETPTSSAGFFDNLTDNGGGIKENFELVVDDWQFIVDITSTKIYQVFATDDYSEPVQIYYTAFYQVDTDGAGGVMNLELRLEGVGLIPGTQVSIPLSTVANNLEYKFGIDVPFYLPAGFIPTAGQVIGLYVSGDVADPLAVGTYVGHLTGSIKQEVNRAVTLIEQYKASQEEELLVFRECGLVGDVINPGNANPSQRYHGAPVNLPGSANAIDQGSDNPMQFKFEDGDAWTKVRPYGYLYPEEIAGASRHPLYNAFFWEAIDSCIIVSTIIEDPYFSDYWPSNFDGFGRLFGEDNDFKQVNQINGLKYTGTYLQGTQINNLNAVDFDSVAFTDIADGEIFAIKQVGFTLKCIQDARLTSFYLGRETVANPQGTQDLVLSDNVLSNANPSELDFGTKHPESVVRHDRELYFFDVNYGKVIRDSANGMIPISDYKAASIFKALSEQLNVKPKSGEVVFSSDFVRSSWNDDLNSLVITYDRIGIENDPPPIDPFTISFQEGANRWKSYHSYLPEGVAFLGRTFVSFIDGNPYLHNVDNVRRGTFYGVEYPSAFSVISNYQPDDVKTFDAIAIQTSRKPSRVIISTPPNEFYKEGMYSRLLEPNFRWIEGNLYSSFKKDLYTPGMEGRSDVDKLNNGRELRGNVARVTVEFSPGEKVVTTRVIIELAHSKKSGRG